MDPLSKVAKQPQPSNDIQLLKNQILSLLHAKKANVGIIEGSTVYHALMQGKPTQDIREDIREVALFFLNGEPVQKNESWAFDLYKLAADLGDIPAMHKVAEMYGQGVGVNQNIPQKFYYLEMVARGEELEFHKDGVYQDSLFKAAKLLADMGDVSEILNLASQLASEGHVDSMLYLSDAYQHGKGVSKDEKLAEHYLQVASEKCKPNNAQQNYEIGIRYFKRANEIGRDIVSSGAKSMCEKAFKFFEVAANLDHAEANLYLWCCYQLMLVHSPFASTLPMKAWPALKKAVELKSVDAEYTMGKILFRIAKDPETWISYTKLAYHDKALATAVEAKKAAYECLKTAAEAKVQRAATFIFWNKADFSEWITPNEAKDLLAMAAYDYKLPADLFNLGKLQLCPKDPLIEENLEEGFSDCLQAVKRANELNDPLGGSADLLDNESIEEKVLLIVADILTDKKITWDMPACNKLGDLLTVIKTFKTKRHEADFEIQRVSRLLVQQKEISGKIANAKKSSNKTDPIYDKL